MADTPGGSSASRVTKRFGGLIAVSSVDFTIPERSIVSLIGPNGAGKTTFFNIIAGIYDPTGGRDRVPWHADDRPLATGMARAGRLGHAGAIVGLLTLVLGLGDAAARHRSSSASP